VGRASCYAAAHVHCVCPRLGAMVSRSLVRSPAQPPALYSRCEKANRAFAENPPFPSCAPLHQVLVRACLMERAGAAAGQQIIGAHLEAGGDKPSDGTVLMELERTYQHNSSVAVLDTLERKAAIPDPLAHGRRVHPAAADAGDLVRLGIILRTCLFHLSTVHLHVPNREVLVRR